MREPLRKILETEEQRRTGQPRPGAAPPGGLRVTLRPTSEAVIARREDANATPEHRAADHVPLERTASLAAPDAVQDARTSGTNSQTVEAHRQLPPNAPAEATPPTGLGNLNFKVAQNGAGAAPSAPLEFSDFGGLTAPRAAANLPTNGAIPTSLPPMLQGVDPAALSVGQWMSVLNNTFADHQPPQGRYSAVTNALEAAPADLRLELRSRFLTRQNPNSAQTQRLLETLRGRDAERSNQQRADGTRAALRDQRSTLPGQHAHQPFSLEPLPPATELGDREPQADRGLQERGGVTTEAKRAETLHATAPKATRSAPRAKAQTQAPKIQKPVRRASEQLPALQPSAARTNAEPTAPGFTAEKPPAAAKPSSRKPGANSAEVQLKRPDLKGADATQRAQIERELKQSQTHAAQFMQGMRARQTRLERLRSSLPTNIRNATRSAVTSTQAAGRQQRAAVTARIAQLIAQASATAASTERQINSRAAAAKAAVPRITQTLSQQMKTAHGDALTQAEAKREPQRAVIDRAYEGKRGAFQAGGEAIGAKALPKADVKAQAYLARPTPADQDGLLYMGVRESDRNKARADAAHQVGASYATGLPEEAAKQLDKLKSGSEEGFGVEHDFGQLEELIFKPFRTSADDVQKNGLDALKTSETQALQGIEQAKAQFTQSLQARLQSTLAQLNAERGSLTQVIDHLTARNVAQISTQGNASVERVNTTLRTLAQGVDRAMSGVQGKLKTQGAPKPKDLQRVLRAIEKQVETALGTQIKGVQQSTTQTQKQLETLSAQGAARLGQTASSGLAKARSTEAQLIQAAAGLIAAATQSFQALEQSHQTGAQKHLQSTQASYKQMLGGVDQIISATPAELDKKLSAALESMKAGLEQSLESMNGVIEKNAEDAASKVPPRWKGLLKILLVIAVLIVVALVLGPAVIAAAGTLLGSGLLGAIVGGAILGAVSGAVIQMGSNVIDEKPIMEGVAKAALTGAVAGAVGGFLGAGVGALTSGITSTGARIAVGGTLDVGVGLVSGGVGQLAGGDSIGQVLEGFKPDRLLETLSSPDQLIGMAMSIASHKSLPPGSRVHVDGVDAPRLNLMERTQARFAGAGENFGFKVADVTGLKTANVRTNVNPELRPNQQEVSGYSQGRVKLEVSANVNPRDVRIHEEVARQVRADNSRLTQLKENVFGSNRETPINSRKYELEFEASKHNKMAEWREAEAIKLSAAHPDRPRLLAEASALRERAKIFTNESNHLNDQLPKGKIAADNDVFNLDPKQAKNNMWPNKGRPSNFSRDTLDTLAAQQPNEHVAGTRNLDGDLSRNHIIAFDHRVKVTVNEIRGMTVQEVTQHIKSKYGIDVPENTIKSVLETMKIPLTGDYNDPKGLYVGDSGDNSSLGSQMRHANDRRGKIDPITDPDAFKAASREVAELTVDVPEGKVGGQALQTNDLRTIADINDIHTNWNEINTLRTEAREVNTGAKPYADASPEFQDAFTDYAALKTKIEHLRALCKDGSPEANQQTREALIQAVQMERLMSEVLFTR